MRGLIDNSVNLGGEQTITGAKKFMQTNIDVDNPPTDEVARGAGLTFVDKNGVRIGKIEPKLQTSGSMEFSMASNQKTDYYTTLTTRAKPDGKLSVYTTAGSNENNTVVTTVSHKYTDVNNIKFGNGLIINWGKSNSPNTVTFSQPYTDTPTVLITQNRTNADERNVMVNTVTTTNFKIFRYSTEGAGVGVEWFSIGI